MGTRWDGAQKQVIAPVSYTPEVGILPESAVSYDSDGNGASVDLTGALDGATIEREEIAAGIWDNADVRVFRTISDDPVEDDVPDFAGKLGKADPIGEIELSIRMVGLSKELDTQVGIKTSVTCRAQLGDSACKVRVDPPEWPANTSVSVREDEDAGTGDVVKPSTENGRHFKCVTAGTTGSSEPSWDTTIGNVTDDGSAQWEAIRAISQSDTVQSVTNTGEFTGALGFPDDWFGAGEITFTSGANEGLTREIQSYVSDTYTMWTNFPFEVKAGDTFFAEAGCRKLFDDYCVSKFDNNLNNRSFPFAAGPSVFNTFGGQSGS